MAYQQNSYGYNAQDFYQAPSQDSHNGAGAASQEHFDIYNTYANDSQAALTQHAQPMAYSPAARTNPYGDYQEKQQPSSYFQPQYGMPSPGSYSPYRQVRDEVLNRREKQQVPLVNGNLVLECPVPQSILTYAKAYGNQPNEFKTMRYTACTSDPDDFVRQKYTLRPKMFGRQTSMAIVVTMYNENAELFDNTMRAVVKNIQHLQSRTKSKTWGANAWEKIVVVIVADGRAKIDARVLKMLSLYGCYQDGIAKDTVNKKEVQAHIYEYTTQVLVDHEGNVSGGIAPVQMCFVLKEQNKKKLNSHRWFFNAVCQSINPNVCVLIDAGTKPTSTSLYHLYKSFEIHPNVGGNCGEICVDTGKGCSNLINPLVAAQNFEYKMSNILDKSTESIFGFISVLPGAFSAYRYKALLGAPLQAYFLGEKMHEPGYVGSAAESNMYLAEDRILAFEIVTKKKEAWVLRYVKSAKATTDAPAALHEFISQRRRWLNGSFFASTHSLLHFYRIWTSGHNVFRCFWLQIEFIYNLVNLIFTFFAPANFYLAFFFLCSSATADPENDPFGGKGNEVLEFCTNFWIALLFVILVCSMGNRPAGAKFAYLCITIAFAALFGIALYCAGFTIWLNVPHTAEGWKDWQTLIGRPAFRNIVISLASTYFLYVISSLVQMDPWHIFTCFVQYMLLLPSFVNILSIFAFSNLHDISWGTKGQTQPAALGKANSSEKNTVDVDLPTAPADIDSLWVAARKELTVPEKEVKAKRSTDQKQSDSMANFRTNVLLSYLGGNMVLVLFFTSNFFLRWIQRTLDLEEHVNPYLVFLFFSVAGLSAVRAFGSISYMFMRLVFRH